ncbi:unnamed protein product [Paramecium sonneborni]|uniref:Uncharacterized protein n=1 Tax=Paramecium sonneborni TaxID=65129 RepID=A0A8S1RM32_9CILI|nr:unnamed protein product [Paramecium sonneborni]
MGYGPIEIYITNFQTLKLINSKINQGEKSQFKGLHQYPDCYWQKVKHNYYLTSIFLTSIFDLQIDGLIIYKSQSQNYPLLYVKSQDKAKQIQQEKILQSNMLLITQLQQQTSIIFIESSQPTQIKLSNNQFYENILLEYLQDSLQPSAFLLNIDCYLGTIEISNSKFSKTQLLIVHMIQFISKVINQLWPKIFFNKIVFMIMKLLNLIYYGENLNQSLHILKILNKSLTGYGQFLL